MDILSKQFKYIKSTINDKGQLVDKKLNSPLEFQYHYSSFILSSVLLSNKCYLDKVVNNYLSIPKQKMKASNDFNVFILLLALECDKEKLLVQYKDDILKSIYHHNNKELYKLNNNFRALRFVGLILEDKIKNSCNNEKKISEEVDWILNLQFDDGFFPDSNMEYTVEKNRGIPHLTYHSKITMCMGIAYTYTKNKRLLTAFNKAVRVLLDLSIENYYFFYGRSTNALFGYASFYLVLILSYKFNFDRKYLVIANKMLRYLKKFQHEDGHISINLNYYDDKRLGFDAYMYDIVYNVYSNAIFLYANSILKNININEDDINKDEDKTSIIFIYKNSGFVVFKNENVKYVFNFKGHQNSVKHKFDSRLSPFSLLYYKKDKKNLLPSVGYKPSGISALVENKFLLNKIYSKLYYLINYDWIPILSGNSFYYVKNGIKLYPFRLLKVLILKNTLIIKFESKSRGFFSKREIFDSFVISIVLSKEPKYKIIFYDKINTLFYSYREIISERNFQYKFSSAYKKLKVLNIETSYYEAELHRYRFEDIRELEIKVNTRDK